MLILREKKARCTKAFLLIRATEQVQLREISSTNRFTYFYPCTEILRLSGEVLRHLPAAGGEIQNSSSSHVCCLHVMSIVKAALAAGTAGTAASTTTHIAAAARGITACCAAGWT